MLLDISNKVSAIVVCSVVIVTTKMNDTIQEMRNLDTNVDMFLLYEELETTEGKSPPMAKKDMSEFLHIKRRMFVKCFHVIVVQQLSYTWHVTYTTPSTAVCYIQASFHFFVQSLSKAILTSTMEHQLVNTIMSS